jgi:hypothetical protein
VFPRVTDGRLSTFKESVKSSGEIKRLTEVALSYYDRIKACNTYDATAFRPFRVEGDRVGWVRQEFAAELARWPKVFLVQKEWVALVPELRSLKERSLAVQEVIRELVARGSIARWHGEKYPVTASSRDQALLWVDRSAAPYFGIRAFGQHVNGYVPTDDGPCMWLGKRAKTKWSRRRTALHQGN